jgi:hypothetical protein
MTQRIEGRSDLTREELCLLALINQYMEKNAGAPVLGKIA